jgi:Protein of unknown function (DUF3017)
VPAQPYAQPPGYAEPPYAGGPNAHTRHVRRTGGRLRRTDVRNLPLIIVLALGATGLGYASAVPPHWLRGVLLLAFALLLAGAFRLLLPVRQAGLLAVRSRITDVLCYAGGGLAIIIFGLALPR